MGKPYVLLTVSVVLILVAFIGGLGVGLDEKYMVYSGVSVAEIGGDEHEEIKSKANLFLLLGTLSFLGLGYSVFKIRK